MVSENIITIKRHLGICLQLFPYKHKKISKYVYCSWTKNSAGGFIYSANEKKYIGFSIPINAYFLISCLHLVPTWQFFPNAENYQF